MRGLMRRVHAWLDQSGFINLACPAWLD